MQTESIVEAAREYYAELYGSKTLESGARDCFLGEVKQKIKAPEEMNKQIQMEELDEAIKAEESIGCMFYPLLKEDLPILSPIHIALKKK
ncbi:unnamed protein product [Lampetra fluviatilis]